MAAQSNTESASRNVRLSPEHQECNCLGIPQHSKIQININEKAPSAELLFSINFSANPCPVSLKPSAESMWRGIVTCHRAQKLGAQTQLLWGGPLGLSLWSSHSLSMLTCCMRACTWLLQSAGTCCMPSSDPLQSFTPALLVWYIWLKVSSLYPRGFTQPHK